MTDPDRRVLPAAISATDLHDSHGSIRLLGASRRPRPFLARCFADRAQAGERVATATLVAVTVASARRTGSRALPCIRAALHGLLIMAHAGMVPALLRRLGHRAHLRLAQPLPEARP